MPLSGAKAQALVVASPHLETPDHAPLGEVADAGLLPISLRRMFGCLPPYAVWLQTAMGNVTDS
jgi:hypothetical protein